jgi:hypothetical protein
MKRYLPILTALAMSLMSTTFIPSLKASDSDKKTTITISQPVAVERTILPAGQYVLRLQYSTASQNVIYIFNGEETRLITTILAIHAYRLVPTDRSEFKFYDSPAGQPTALHNWFYPGDETGFEFRQTKHTVGAESTVAGD